MHSQFLVRAALAVSLALGAAGVAGVTFASEPAQQAAAAKVNYAPIPGGVYTIDPAHSSIAFAVRHLALANVRGRFNEFSGKITIDEKDVTKSSVEFVAKTASIDTGIAKRDEHLRTADFFDVAKYPEMSFRSTRVERSGDGYVAHGDFTLHGVTKQISIPFQLVGAVVDQKGTARIGVHATTTLDRQDYGISYGSTMPNGGLAIGNEVDVELNVEAFRPDPKAAAQ